MAPTASASECPLPTTAAIDGWVGESSETQVTVVYEGGQSVQVDLYSSDDWECEGADSCVWFTVLDEDQQAECGFIPSAEELSELMAEVDMIGLSVHGKTLAQRCKEYDKDNPATGWDAALCPIQQALANFYAWLYEL
ncbi:MAG: hypothetical protein K0V04_24830 [Deltaproteobacteria bacterium]|nr:hypothetical protein [Deltaproteobacteria bacterium]